MTPIHIFLVTVSCLCLTTLAAGQTAPTIPDLPQFERRIQKDGNKSLPYRLLIPANYDKSKAYPLVVWLHGAGEKGDDNVAQLKGLAGTWLAEQKNARHPAFILVPQCPKDSAWFGIGYNKRPETPDCILLTVAAIADVRKEFNIDD